MATEACLTRFKPGKTLFKTLNNDGHVLCPARANTTPGAHLQDSQNGCILQGELRADSHPRYANNVAVPFYQVSYNRYLDN